MSIVTYNMLRGAINQSTNPHLLKDDEVEMAVNIVGDIRGAIARRPGTELFLNKISDTNGVKGLHSYVKSNSQNYVHMVHDGNLYFGDESVSAFTLQQSSLFSASSTVEFANFLGRHYLIGSEPTEYLSYVTDSGVATVVSGNIQGKYLASNGPYLLATGQSTNPRRTVWSNAGSDTFSTTVDYVDASIDTVGCASFGNQKPFIVFTSQSYVIVDPFRNYFNEVPGFGCASHRSIKNIRGTLIWLSRDGGCWYALSQGQEFPQEISSEIVNSYDGSAVFDNIDGTYLSSVAAGEIDGKYICAVGDLTGAVKGQTLNDAFVEFDSSAQAWRTHTYEAGELASVFAEHINEDGVRVLLAGSRNSGSVQRILMPGVLTDDDKDGVSSNITGLLRSKFYEFGMKEATVKSVYIKYKSDGAVTVKRATDGATTYTQFDSPMPAIADGYDYVEFICGDKCKSMSIEFSGTSNFVIYSIVFDVSAHNSANLSSL